MGKLSGYVRIMRPVNCLMMGFAVLVGAALASPNNLNSMLLSLVYGFVTGFALTAASMTINDYYDREIDAINEPKRPIPSGLIKPREAILLATALTIIGFATAYLTNLTYPLCLVIAIIAWIIFVTYTTIGKRSGLPGNFLVSMCVTIPFIYGSIAALGEIKLNVLLFSSMVFLSNTGREITKGIVDIEGDKTKNVKTLAARHGANSAAIAAAAFYLSAVSLSPIPWFLGLVSFWFIPIVLITDLGLVSSSFMLLKNHSRENSRKIKKTVLLWFLVGLLAFAAGTLR